MSKGRDKKEDREDKAEQQEVASGKIKLEYKGEQVYQGHLDGQFRKLWPGAVIEVSVERAMKLKMDYPKLFVDSQKDLSLGDVPKPAEPGAGKIPVANKAVEAEGKK